MKVLINFGGDSYHIVDFVNWEVLQAFRSDDDDQSQQFFFLVFFWKFGLIKIIKITRIVM